MEAEQSKFEILEKLWEWAKELQLQPEELGNEVLLSKNNFNRTPRHKAAENGTYEILEKPWEWAKGLQLKPEELRN
jgi:ankyrin repeat protein